MRAVSLIVPALCCIVWNAAEAFAPQSVQFESSVVLALAEPLPNASKVVTGDVNGDGKPDIVIGSGAGVVLLLGRADSQFEAGRVVPVPSACAWLDVGLADLDGDRVLDLVVYCSREGQVFSYRGNGDGSFLAPNILSTGSKALSSRGMAVADLNQDGIADVAIGQDGQVLVLLGNGDATFRAGPALKISAGPSPAQPVALAVADFNQDGVPDLATANVVYDDNISIFLGAGGGRFAAETKVVTGDRPHDLVPVDFDGDGKLDLAVACDSGLLIFAGDGRGSFAAGPVLRSNDRPMSVAAADLNGDGLPDFVVGDFYNGRISVLLNDGDGTFRDMTGVSSIGDVFSVVLADMNGDSVPDVIATSYSGSSALLAGGRGDGEFQPPTYFGVYPANSFPLRLADTHADGKAALAVVLQGRRSISVLQAGSGEAATLRRDDYVLDSVFADFTGDGIPDLALVTVPSWRGVPGEDFQASLRVLPGRADGTFAAEIATPIERCPANQGFGFAPTSSFLTLAAGDFDGDSVVDMALMNAPLGELQIYHGNGDGTFVMTQRFPGACCGTLVSADFDGDGVHDLALLNGRVTIYSGKANGGMVKSEVAAACPFNGSLQKGDFDGNGKTDLLLNCGSDLTVLLNAGGGLFRVNPTKIAATPLTFFSGLAIGDFDLDGKDDIAAINSQNDTSTGRPLGILFSNGDGTFRPREAVPEIINPASLIAMDFDRDGRPDLVVADASDGTLKTLRNKPAAILIQ